jgi:hypothetical protein
MADLRRPMLVLAFLAAGCVLPRAAEAQYGMGWGWGGMGMGGQIGNMAIMNNINDRSASAANYAYSIRQNIPGSGNVYANNPRAFVNNLRDTSYTPRFDAVTRRRVESQGARGATLTLASTGAGSTRPQPTSPAAPAALPLSAFFSAAGMLVWPSEAPTDGPLGSQRVAADSAAVAVLKEVRAQGFAPVAMVNDARERLVDYGRPALEYLGKNSTPAVFDAFHRFMLGLYDALGAAALVPKR